MSHFFQTFLTFPSHSFTNSARDVSIIRLAKHVPRSRPTQGIVEAPEWHKRANVTISSHQDQSKTTNVNK